MRAARWLGLLAAATPASLALPSTAVAALRPEHSTADSTHEESDSGRTGLPSGKGCHTLRDPVECCRSTDGRKGFAGQSCLPTTHVNGHGNVCEPASCFTGLGGACDAPQADCTSILEAAGKTKLVAVGVGVSPSPSPHELRTTVDSYARDRPAALAHIIQC